MADNDVVSVPLKAFQELLRISARNHDAWNQVKAALAAAPQPAQPSEPAPGEGLPEPMTAFRHPRESNDSYAASMHYAAGWNACRDACHATAFEGWFGAIEDAGEIASNAKDDRIVSRARRIVKWLEESKPQPAREVPEAVGELYISDTNAQLCPTRATKDRGKLRRVLGNGVHPLYTTPPAPAVDDATCNAVYAAVTRANFTRDVKTPERRAEIVRAALTQQEPGNER